MDSTYGGKPSVWAGRSPSGGSLMLAGFEEAATLGDSRSLFQGRAPGGEGGPGSAAGSPRAASPFVHGGGLYGGDGDGVAAPAPVQRYPSGLELSHSHSSSSLLRATLQRSMSTSSQMGAAAGGAGAAEDTAALHAGLLSPRARLTAASSPRHNGSASNVLSFDALRSASAGDLTGALADARPGLSRSASALSAQLSGASDAHGSSVSDLSAALQGFVLSGGDVAAAAAQQPGSGAYAEDTVGPLPRVSSRQAFASAAAQAHAQAAQAQLAAAAAEEAYQVESYPNAYGVPPPLTDPYGAHFGTYAPRGMPTPVPPPPYMPHGAPGGFPPPPTRGMPPQPPPQMLYAEQLAMLQMQAQLAQQLGLPPGADPAAAMPPQGYPPSPGMLPRGPMPFVSGAPSAAYYGAPPMYPPGPYGQMDPGAADPAFYAAYYARLMEIQALAHSGGAAALAAASMGAYGAHGGAFGGAFGGPRGLDGSAAAMAMAAGAAAVLGSPFFGMGGPLPYGHHGGGGPGFGGGDRRGGGERDRPPRSSLLEEFKTSKAFKFELRDLVGHVAEFAQDQHGSRFIQQKLETAPADDVAALFTELMSSVNKLMTDVFGNYVVQCFFAHGTEDQRAELVKQLSGRVLPLSLQMYGCRVIQKALEVLNTDGKRALVDELEGHVLTCVHDSNGNHVVQKAIEHCPPELRQRLMASFAGASLRLAQHPYGCRVVQRILEHCTREEQATMCLMPDILSSSSALAKDQYGNYVIQHVLEHGTQDERAQVVRALAGQMVTLSRHKFASNVVEKCIQFCTREDRSNIIAEVLSTGPDGADLLLSLMTDQFSNYVLQRLLDCCDDDQKAKLVPRMRAHLGTVKKFAFGKHIASAVERMSAVQAADGGSPPAAPAAAEAVAT